MTTSNDIRPLIERAIAAMSKAYAPYSNYRVGAVLQTPDETVFDGCNIENAAYPATICAERTALVKAVSEGQREFDVLVVASANGGAPCGVCRQMLFEFAPDLRVIIVNEAGTISFDGLLSDLLPRGFGPKFLED